MPKNLSGRAIGVIRTRRGWSQRQLADAAQLNGYDLEAWQVRNIESGQRQVNDIELVGIAQALGVSVSVLLEAALTQRG